MRICFVCDTAYPLLADSESATRFGGGELQQVLLARALAARGHELCFVTPDFGQGPAERIGAIEVFSSFRPEAGFRGLRFFHPRLSGLWSALARADAEIYYVRTAAQVLAVVAAFARIQGRKSVFAAAHDRDFLPDELLLGSRRERWLYHWGLRRCDAVWVQNVAQQHSLRAWMGRDSRRVGNGYPTRPAPPARGTKVLWAASFRRAKRAERFVALARALPRAHFVMLGGPDWGHSEDPGHFERVREEARGIPNLEVRGAVPLPEVEREISEAAVLVNTSEAEGFPNTFLQCWAQGVPVVSFVDPDGLIAEHELGIVVHDEAGLAAAVQSTLDRPEAFPQERLRRVFEDRLGLDALVVRAERHFRELLEP